jgi:anaerobic ribonucleoside-triphosphate reductase activating protein
MKIHLNKAHFPVNGLGPGQRIGLWFQGCSIRCSGCVSLDTWGLRPETAVDADEIVAWCRTLLDGGADGITVSGGEPFDQPEGLVHLLRQLRSFADRNTIPIDILCFTGLRFSIVEKDYSEVLSLLDAIVSEPFEESSPTTKYLCGSANQALRILNEKCRDRYNAEGSENPLTKHMDVSVLSESLYLSGIPREGDLGKLRDAMKARGVNLEKVSWRE